MEGGGLPPYLFVRDEPCALCGRAFPAASVRLSRLTVSSRDSDFRVNYDQANPYLYTVWVCPHCGYAAPEGQFQDLSAMERQALKNLLAGRRPAVDFSGERTLEVAIGAYKLAIYQAQRRGARASAIAALCVRAAWACRPDRDPRERDFLQMALDHYLKAYDHEPLPIGKMSERGLQYLLGELYLRTGRPADAVAWFSRVVQDGSGEERNIVDMAREGWRRAREAKA